MTEPRRPSYTELAAAESDKPALVQLRELLDKRGKTQLLRHGSDDDGRSFVLAEAHVNGRTVRILIEDIRPREVVAEAALEAAKVLARGRR